MGHPHVVSALIRLRAKLAGEILELRDRQQAIKADMAHVDAVLAVLGWEGKPFSIRPARKPGNRLFAPKQLSRLVYDAMREGARDNGAIAKHVMKAMGWDASDAKRLADVRRRVKDVTKRLP